MTALKLKFSSNFNANNQRYGENWSVVVLVFISLALHSEPKPHYPRLARAGR